MFKRLSFASAIANSALSFSSWGEGEGSFGWGFLLYPSLPLLRIPAELQPLLNAFLTCKGLSVLVGEEKRGLGVLWQDGGEFGAAMVLQ